MISAINIIGFLILMYTAYLIVTEGSNKKSENDGADESVSEVPKKEVNKTPSKPKAERKSAPVQQIEGDTDVLRQGRSYSEQLSNDEPNITPQSQQHFETRDEVVEPVVMQAPSSKNREPQYTTETVSVVCPYCDNKVLVPKGGHAECSCCSSILNDNGGVVD